MPCKKITGTPSVFPCSAYSSLTLPGSVMDLTTGCGGTLTISDNSLANTRLMSWPNDLIPAARLTNNSTTGIFFIQFILMVNWCTKIESSVTEVNPQNVCDC